MSYVISSISTKGGVGKSTLTKFLTIAFEKMGKKVCVIDFCQNGSVATSFLMDRDSYDYTVYDWLVGDAKASQVINQFRDSGVYYIPSDARIGDYESYVEKKFKSAEQRRNSIKNKIEPLKRMFDVIIFDTHPSENDKMVSFAMMASDMCIIPLETDLDSKLGTIRSIEIINQFIDRYEELHGLEYVIIPNKVSMTNRKLRTQLKGFIKEMIEEGVPKDKFLSRIRHSDIVPSSKNEKMMLDEYKNNKYAKRLLGDFDVVAKEIDFKLTKGGKNND